MKTLFLTFMISLSAYSSDTTYVLKSSDISYTITFPLKTVVGKSTDAKGKGVCDTKLCEFLIASPVKSFKSGDTNRDVHMLEVTKAAQFPLISINTVNLDPEKLNSAVFEIEFAGTKKTIKGIPLNKTVHGKTTDISTAFSILLSDFRIERPSLLGVSIDDKVEINVKTQWETNNKENL